MRKRLQILVFLSLWLLPSADVSCEGSLCRNVVAEGLGDGGDSLLQHASRQLHETNKSDRLVRDSGAVFPNSFSSFANVMLGRDEGTMESCGAFIQQVMGQAFSKPTEAAQTMLGLLTQSRNQVDSIKCLKMALDYADQNVLPADCMLQNGKIHPSCCVYEKRCSSTNPLDGCPALVFPPRNIFDQQSSDVTCVGSHELSPVATGVCMCKDSKVCVKESGQSSKCV